MEDERDILFQLRNSFYLGNYYKVLEMWKDYAKFEFQTHGSLVKSLIIRSIVKLGKNYKKYFENLDISPFKKDLPIFGKYLTPLNGKVIRIFIIYHVFIQSFSLTMKQLLKSSKILQAILIKAMSTT